MTSLAVLRLRRDYQSGGITDSLLRRFRRIIHTYYKNHGRPFAWRETTNPYHVLVSEFMLQQTQTSRVTGKYLDFISAFPDFPALAAAPLRDILAVWQGLGYNRRAMYLKQTAVIIMQNYHGMLPASQEELARLPGIGYNTAGAIAAFSFNQPVVFIETNIRSVYHYFFFSDGKNVSDTQLLPIVEVTLDKHNPRHWYYALYDYGAMLKRERKATDKPKNRQTKFEGSDRQVRGAILRILLDKPVLTREELCSLLDENLPRLLRILAQLEAESFITISEQGISLKS